MIVQTLPTHLHNPLKHPPHHLYENASATTTHDTHIVGTHFTQNTSNNTEQNYTKYNNNYTKNRQNSWNVTQTLENIYGKRWKLLKISWNATNIGGNYTDNWKKTFHTTKLWTFSRKTHIYIGQWNVYTNPRTLNDHQANGLACTGKYEAGSIPSFAGDKSLFVKSHAYWSSAQFM